jgi:hypothetical protein
MLTHAQFWLPPSVAFVISFFTSMIGIPSSPLNRPRRCGGPPAGEPHKLEDDHAYSPSFDRDLLPRLGMDVGATG